MLFGDEPTGNLDWGNATKVMETLLQHIRRNHRTGLVVSHDIHLSTAFADRIVLLTGKNDSKQTAKQSGQILKSTSLLESDSWRSLSATMTNSQLVSFLQTTSSNTPRDMNNKQLDSLLFKLGVRSLAGGKASGPYAF